MGLLKLVIAFGLIWLGILFIVLGLNALMSLNLPPGSTSFYVGVMLTFLGMFLIVIGICYVVLELRLA